MDDARWLAEFVATGSEAAFARLVARHVDLVYSAALRRTRDRHLAEEVTQLTFIALARKARALRRETVLSAWLIVTTRYIATDVLRARDRRRRHEQMAAAMAHKTSEPPPADANEWEAISPVLDDALARLGAQDRRAIMLRYFEGRDAKQVAEALGISPDAARQRLHRATLRLRELLTAQRGLELAPAAIESLIVAHAIHAAPGHLAASSTAAALAAKSAAAAAGASLGLGGGWKGAVILMASTQTKILTAAAAVLLLAGGSVATWKAIQPRGTQQQQQQVVLSPSAPIVPAVAGNWRERFDQVYGLRDGEYLKEVDPPLIPERQAFWDDQMKKNKSTLYPQERFTVEWNGTGYNWKYMTFAPSLEQGLSASHLRRLDMDSSIPVNLPFDGDWVYRKGATTQQVMHDLGPIVSKRLGRTVYFERRHVLHDAIIVRGHFHFTPLDGYPNDGIVDLIGHSFLTYPGPTVRHTTIKKMLEEVPDLTNERVFDETGQSDLPVTIRLHSPTNGAKELLENLAHQTGLEFTHEKRPMDIWFMVDSAAPGEPAWKAALDAKYALSPDQVLRRIDPPFGPERAECFAKSAEKPAADGGAYFEYDGKTQPKFATTKVNLASLLMAMAGQQTFASYNIDESIPLMLPLGGDWTIRKDAPLEQKLAALAPMLSQQMGHPVHFVRRDVMKDVLVARGPYTLAVPAGAAINFAPNPPRREGPMFDVNRITVAEMLRQIEATLNTRVVDETGASATHVLFCNYYPSRSPDAALQYLTRQSGIQFVREQRKVSVWALADGADSGGINSASSEMK